MLFTYSPEFQREAAQELDYVQNAGVAPNLVVMLNDYHTTRETIRTCQ